MLLLTTKRVVIKGSIVKVYSIDGGKLWFSRPKDLRLFKQRRRDEEKATRRIISTHVKDEQDE